jgi:hypothetical protein
MRAPWNPSSAQHAHPRRGSKWLSYSTLASFDSENGLLFVLPILMLSFLVPPIKFNAADAARLPLESNDIAGKSECPSYPSHRMLLQGQL